MESVGNFVFNRKDLLGHGAFAVVFKGRHKENPELEVAVKCISKKKLSSSPSLLGKEIRILKELKHDNIVHLLDFQEISGSVYLVMEFCNGGDLADYLDSKGCLSEDTIRSFLQQIAGAMSILRSKGIIHRDLKPQNILLSYSAGRRVSPHNICIKLADFGFARYLQGNMVAATLCGSPMYMAPEVIMSQNYDAKADLWSVGTIVFQCLTGSTPFQARSPQELRLFYERNRKLNPHIPRETSSHLRDLLCGLLQRNHRKRMDFDAFFNHPFLEASPVVRKCEPSSSKTTLPVPIPLCPNSSFGSSSSGSSTSNPTPIQSEIESPKPHPPHKTTPPSFSELKGFSCSETEDFVMVPTQFLNEMRDQHKQDIVIQTGGSPLYPGFFVGGTPLPSPSICVSPSPIRPMECYGSSYSQSVPIPVPTQIHKYQRMEQNLQGASRTVTPSSPGYCTGGFISPSHRRLFTGWSRPRQLSPKVGTILETSDQSEPQCSRTVSQEEHVRSQNQVFPLFSDVGAMETPLPPGIGSHRHSPHTIVHRWELGRRASLPITLGRTRTMPDLQEPCMTPTKTAERKPQKISYLKRSSSAGQLSDMLLKVVFESQLEKGSCEGLNTERTMNTIAPPGGIFKAWQYPRGPGHILFTVGTPPDIHTPPPTTRRRQVSVFSSNSGSPGWKYGKDPKSYTAPERYCCGFTDITASSLFGDIAFEPPELQTETLMEKSHTDTLTQLRFILAFTHCVMGMAAAKDTGIEKNETSDDTVLKQSQLADQISRLSQEWSCAEQLVLYMKCAEFLSSALQTAKEMIEMGKLYPFASVKQGEKTNTHTHTS